MSQPFSDRAQELFAAALERPPEQRAAFLAATSPDAALRAEVLSLLEAHDRGGRLDGLLSRLDVLQPVASSAEDLPVRLHAALGERYAIERELGRGGMAIVFLARDLKHSRNVALKILHPELAHGLGTARFLQEIAIAARLVHPHILPLHDSGVADGLLYYVMPFVEGESLRQRLLREGRLPLDDAVRIAREVADALDYAHSHRLIHRDIKPENILLEAGHAVVSDFGIACAMTAAGGDDPAEMLVTLGTPAYMSPEQAACETALDGRSDVYSLGCVLYEMLTGAPPFSRAADRPHNTASTALAALPAGLTKVMTRALARAPARRFATAAEFERALVRATVRRAAAQRRRIVTAAALALVASVSLAAVLLSRPRSPVHPAASVLAVLPIAAPAGDTALSRLGRDLVLTLSTNLDGIGGLRTIDALTILAQTRDSRELTINDGFQLAGRYGASGIVNGSIARKGSSVHIELGVFAIGNNVAITRTSLDLDTANIAHLTDTLTWSLLREIWRARAPPTPNLAALTTRSLPALRAFLEGEQLALESRWDTAAHAYARAMHADSNFWLATWRYCFARWWYLEAVDDALVNALYAHRFALPERDRLVLESWYSDSISVALAKSGEVVRRFPEYWPGWMQHADWLFHTGPVYGHDRTQGRAALERTVALNPSLIPAWEHLYWAALPDDTITAARALAALERLGFARTTTAEFGFDIGRVYRFELAARRSGTIDGNALDSIVVELVNTARGRLGSGATFAPAQIAISQRVLRTSPAPARAGLHERLLADAWASRGAWDSALVAADRYTHQPGSDVLYAYRMAVIGAWLGALTPDIARRQRDLPARAAARSDVNAMFRAELAWLDGLLAATTRDQTALLAARMRLRLSDTVSTALLDRTLGAFDTQMAGESALAARTLAAINWRNPDLLVPGYSAHPFVIAISRLAAARWLAAHDQAAEAERALHWFDAGWALDGYRPARRILAPLATLERARLAAARRQIEQARRLYREFSAAYDLPTLSHRELVEEASAALVKLPG